MTFTWLNKQGVRSSQGFEFQFTGRLKAEYRERGRVTELYVEDTSSGITAYEGDLRHLWNAIPEPTAQEQERHRIIENVRSALAFQGLALDLAS
jgi:hypothetical protein